MYFKLSQYSKLSLAVLAALSSISVVAKDSDLESVVVIGHYKGTKPSSLVGSYEIIGRDQIANAHVDDNAELFTKLPGVSVSRYDQGPINADLSIRGFDGDGSSPHAKLLIDGIPANMHNGFGELDQIFPLNIDSIQVFKGTSDVKYGLFNIAGNYQVFSRSDVGVTELQTTLGSYNSAEVQGYTGIQSGALTQNYSFGYRQSEGYRDHTDIERYAMSGRWFYDLSNDTKLGYVARYSHFDADSPGYLSLQESRQDPKASASYASQDGGDKTNFHHSLHLQSSLDKLAIDAKAYFQSFERERWVRYSEAGSLQNRFDDQQQTGVIVDTTYQLSDKARILAGFSYQSEDVIEQRFGTLGQVRERDSNNVIRNYDYQVDSSGAYVAVENQWSQKLKWNLGVRADKLGGDFVAIDSNNATSERDIYDFGWIVQPKLNLSYQANADWLLFFNAGESFQHPTGSSLFTVADVNARDVSKNVGWEWGSSFNLTQAANVRVSYWKQTAKDEYVVVDGNALNVGETERSGWETAFNWNISRDINLWANYSSVETEIVNAGSAAAANSGNELRSIPDYTASVGLEAVITEHMTARLHLDSQGDYYVNEANLGGEYGGYTLTNASLDYRFAWAKVSLNLNNIFDKYYEYVYDYSVDGSDTIHAPGEGRNVSVSAMFEF